MYIKKDFVYEVGQVLRLFRKYKLKKTLLDIAGKSSSSLSNFENGKIRKFDYITYYIKQCKNEEQLNELMKLLNQVIYNEWKRDE